jgi:hypothetical protein
MKLMLLKRVAVTLLLCGFILSSIFLSPAIAGSETAIKLIVNGQTIEPDVPPQLINNRTMVPVRFVAEAMGLAVNYQSYESTVIVSRGDDVVQLVVNGKAYKNGVEIPLDVPATIIDNRTLVPVRFIGETFGAMVSWDAASRTITITQGSTGVMINGLKEKPLPENGTIVKYYKSPATSPIEIITRSGPVHYFVKVADWYTREPVITVFIRSGNTFETLIPPGIYEIKYAAGSRWYGDGEDELFGVETICTKADKQFGFTSTSGYTIELIYQVGGNLGTYEISREEF